MSPHSFTITSRQQLQNVTAAELAAAWAALLPDDDSRFPVGRIAAGAVADPDRPGLAQLWVSLSGYDVVVVFAGPVDVATRYAAELREVCDPQAAARFVAKLLEESGDIWPTTPAAWDTIADELDRQEHEYRRERR